MNRRHLFFLLTLLFATMFVAGSAQAQPPDLFFSEYIEGSGNNKALEIYNGTGAAIDLAASSYSVQMFFNGSTNAGLTVDLTGTVADGDVFVLANSGATDPTILAQADQTNGSGWFNGDDAVVLRKGTTVIDAIGQIGFDPGSEWGSGDTSTQDNTLRRNESICAGDTDASNVFDPSLEWTGYAQNTVDGLGTHSASCGPGPAFDVAISEIRIDQPSDDTDEYFELVGAADTVLDGLTYIVIGDGAAGSGVIESVVDLSGQTIGTSGFFVAAESSFSLATADFITDLNFENSDNVTHLLVSDFNSIAGTDLDTDDDGTLDETPWSSVVDCVGLVETIGSGDELYCGTLVGPDGSFVPGHVYLCEEGWQIGAFGGGDDTPGAENACGGEPVLTCDATYDFTLIHEVQGSGASTPISGSEVVIEGVVVGAFQDEDATDSGDLDGFFVQEEDTDADSDTATSEGVFVYAPAAVDVATGDVVRVAGTAEEFFDNTQIDATDGTLAGVVVCNSGVELPTITEITLPVASIDDFEPYEGMYVRFPQDLFISEYFNFDRFGEIVLTTDRQFQPTALFEPGSQQAADEADLNVRSRITMDDGRTNQNPDPAIHPNGLEFTLTNTFRGGDVVANATGVLNYDFGLYRLQPTTGADYTATNPRPGSPDNVGGNIKAASFNVLNYFNTIDNGPDICGPLQNQECRGADTEEERTRQLAKIVDAMVTMNADVLGIIEVENTTGVEAMADIVDGLNASFGPGTYAYVDTGTIGTDAIKVGFIYNTTTVSLVGDYAVLDTPEFVDPNNTGEAKNRPALAQTFMDNETGGIFTATINHLKSKGSPCGPGDDDPEAGSCNLTRTLSAQVLSDWLATDPTGSGDPDFLILGDLNSYDKEDPIDVLKANGYSDLLLDFAGEFAYSYVFDGQLGYLDYGMANLELMSEVTGATAWHINADEPDILDYDMSFKQDAQDALYEPNAFRSSDHDPVIVGLDLNGSPVCTNAYPSVDMLWPVNHKYVSVDVLGVTDPEDDALTYNIDGIFQDEAVDAPDSGNTAPDGKIVDGDTVDLRAERVGDGGNGRVYTVYFTVADTFGGSCSGEIKVSVPVGRKDMAIDDGPLFDSTIVP